MNMRPRRPGTRRLVGPGPNRWGIRSNGPRGLRVPAWLLLGLVALLVPLIGIVIVDRPDSDNAHGPSASPGTAPVAWTLLGTEDAHSLAFDVSDADHLYFGHHGGVFETTDGGRTWQPLPVSQDAMAMAPAGDGSLVIAGHEVFTASADGGRTWRSIAAELPSRDIHGFTRDPTDAAHLWLVLATGGLWESTDGGRRWMRVREDNVFFPLAVGGDAGVRLLGVDASGLVESADGGRTWSALGAPPTYPMTSLAGTPDGRVLYAGSPRGLWRSQDGGRTWTPTSYAGSAFAVATTDGGQTVAVVSREAAFFRSADGGASWPGP